MSYIFCVTMVLQKLGIASRVSQEQECQPQACTETNAVQTFQAGWMVLTPQWQTAKKSAKFALAILHILAKTVNISK